MASADHGGRRRCGDRCQTREAAVAQGRGTRGARRLDGNAGAAARASSSGGHDGGAGKASGGACAVAAQPCMGWWRAGRTCTNERGVRVRVCSSNGTG